MRPNFLRAVSLRLAALLALALLLALAANAGLSQRCFERALMPEMAGNVATVGRSITALLLKAVESGVAFDGLYGVEQTFAEVAAEVPAITWFAVTDGSGQLLYQRGAETPALAAYRVDPAQLSALHRPAAPAAPVRVGAHVVVTLAIVGAAGPLGLLHLGLDPNFVDELLLEMSYDLLVVLLVALFFTLELMHFLIGARLLQAFGALSDVLGRGAAGEFGAAPQRPAEPALGPVVPALERILSRVDAAHAELRRSLDAACRAAQPPAAALVQAGQRLQALAARHRFGVAPTAAVDGELGKLRAPLFVFMLSEELTRSFLPAYVQDLLVPVPGLSPQVVLGLPIVAFMLIVALGQPVLGVLVQRRGTRRMMAAGAALAAAGLACSALAASVLDLLLWRSLCGVGYAMVFGAAQGYVLDHTAAQDRAAGFATFVGAIMVATVCGPPIGGLLADNLGPRWTFGLAAVLALAALACVQLLPSAAAGGAGTRPAARVPGLAQIGSLLANRRFLTLTALAAMPAKILLTGLCFYLVPLYVTESGGSQAMAGRALMAYGVMVVLLSPLAARWAASRRRRELLVGGGLLLSGLGGLVLLAGSDMGHVLVATALVGAGQALSIAAQSALVGEHCRSAIDRLGEGAVFGVYRLLERIGNAAGPLLAAGLVTAWGYRAGFVVLGGFVACCGLLFTALTWRAGSRPGGDADEGLRP